MKWHLYGAQHVNQIGFALTVSYVNPRALDGTEMAGAFACSECGIDAPAVHLEVTILLWTVMLVGHAEESSDD